MKEAVAGGQRSSASGGIRDWKSTRALLEAGSRSHWHQRKSENPGPNGGRNSPAFDEPQRCAVKKPGHAGR